MQPVALKPLDKTHRDLPAELQDRRRKGAVNGCRSGASVRPPSCPRLSGMINHRRELHELFKLMSTEQGRC